MSDLELVVARFAEDLRWIRRLPESCRVTVYNKGPDLPGATVLPNIGHEAHTYLSHIVARYDSLADTTVFCQGRPFDHVPELHRQLRELAEGQLRVSDFRWLGFIIDYDDPQGTRLFKNWSKNPNGRLLDCNGFWNALWNRPAPERMVFYPGAHFAVTRAQIRSQSRVFYQQALALSIQFPDAGHCLERCWDAVFGCHGIPEKHRGKELPIYLRPIQRLGLTWDAVDPADRGWE
ncbi:MAG: DUF3431 domain-containing protein [Verrucomicrobia bacterium]|nr:DUF3431 domain-containing protein [Verrucomicrobiota bacterium]